MRTRPIFYAGAAVLAGTICGSMLAPRPTGAVSKEMIQLQDSIAQLQAGQQAMRTAIDANNASMHTLIQQQMDTVNNLSAQMKELQKTVGESSANDGAKIDTMATQTQGVSDNIQDVQARVGKLAAQMNDMQSTLQSIDGRLSGGGTISAPPTSGAPNGAAPAAAGPSGAASAAPAGGLSSMPGIQSDTLYQNALRDFTTGKYDLSRQEFSDYVKNFPNTDLASNAQFYLGEISYQQGDFKDAITQYNLVLGNYPQSFKLAAALLKKALAELELGIKATATRDLKEVVRRFPGSDEARRAQAKLKELGVATTTHTAPR